MTSALVPNNLRILQQTLAGLPSRICVLQKCGFTGADCSETTGTPNWTAEADRIRDRCRLLQEMRLCATEGCKIRRNQTHLSDDVHPIRRLPGLVDDLPRRKADHAHGGGQDLHLALGEVIQAGNGPGK